MRYFGILKEEEIRYLSIIEIEEYLVSEKIYHNGFSTNQVEKMLDPSFKYNFNEIETDYFPTVQLINEFHKFIFNTYKEKAIMVKYNYKIDFNEYCYGMAHFEKREVALGDFIEMFDKLNIVVPPMVDERSAPNGLTHTVISGKLFQLYYHQTEFKKNIAQTENLISYLTGNVKFYDNDFYDNNINIQNAVHLEIITQILVEINEIYGFEEDIYFSKKVHETFKFKEYDNIFKTLNSYRFTNKTLSTCKKIKRAHIESLYQVLLDFDLINNHKENFMAFIKTEYQFTITKISTFAPNQNLLNDKRVKELTQEWKNFDVVKTELDIFKDI